MKSVLPCLFVVPAAKENHFAVSFGDFSWAASWALHATSGPCPGTFSVPVPGYRLESLRDLMWEVVMGPRASPEGEQVPSACPFGEG